MYLTKNGYGTMIVLSLNASSGLTERVKSVSDEAGRMAEEEKTWKRKRGKTQKYGGSSQERPLWQLDFL